MGALKWGLNTGPNFIHPPTPENALLAHADYCMVSHSNLYVSLSLPWACAEVQSVVFTRPLSGPGGCHHLRDAEFVSLWSENALLGVGGV